MKLKVLVTCPIAQRAIEKLRERFDETGGYGIGKTERSRNTSFLRNGRLS